MSQDRLFALGAGVAGALMFIAALTGFPGAMLLLYVAPLPLLLIGLAHGFTATVLAGGVSSAIILAVAGLKVGLVFGLAFAAPTALLVRQVLLSRPGASGTTEWYPPGLVVGWLAIFGAGAILAASLALSGDEGGLEGVILASLPEALDRLTGGDAPAELAERAKTWASFLPAMMGAVWAAVMVINACVAQSALVRLDKARRSTPDYAALEPPGWLIYALAGALLVALVGPEGFDFAGQNVAVVLAMPYFFVGLAVIHSYARRFSSRTMILTIFYILLILLGLIAMVAAAALGFAEQFVHLRRRWANPGTV
jgi:hypothetical protein